MKLVPDTTRRFTKRPHYEPRELDLECEQIAHEFLRSKYGVANFPISTGDLTILLERAVDDLDSAADLSSLGPEVEGVTYFFRRSKPKVKIARSLWDKDTSEHRLRTTLSHEFGHVHFHGYLYQEDESLQSFLDSKRESTLKCLRTSVHGPPSKDWMEWQAGYVSGSLLMPTTRLEGVVRDFHGTPVSRPYLLDSDLGRALIAAVSVAFQVSKDAARVRLSQLKHLVSDTGLPLN